MTGLYKKIILDNGREIEGPANIVDSTIDFHGTHSVAAWLQRF
jgi:hypothetical protein